MVLAAAGLVLRGSYDRVFQTPAFENILLASSAAVDSLNDNVLRLPVRSFARDFYEAGLAKGSSASCGCGSELFPARR